MGELAHKLRLSSLHLCREPSEAEAQAETHDQNRGDTELGEHQREVSVGRVGLLMQLFNGLADLLHDLRVPLLSR